MMTRNSHLRMPEPKRVQTHCTLSPIPQFFTAMIDKTIFNGPLGAPLPQHQTHISSLKHSRNLQSNSVRATTFINSPITRCQIDAEYSVEVYQGVPTAFVRLTLPLSTALGGHNYAHAGLDSVGWEVKGAAALCKVTLATLGFTPEEIDRFMKGAKAQQLELTWHTCTASRRAKLSLQKRTKQHFDGLLSIKGRHDIQVSNVEYREGDGSPGIIVTLKANDMIRQYGKADQIRSRKRKDRDEARMAATVRHHRLSLLDAIEDHVRNEVIAGAATLQELGLEHPGSWNTESLNRLIDHILKAAGLAPQQPTVEHELSPEVEDTWRRYRAGENVQESLPAHTFSRHRTVIKEAKGEDKDIAIPLKSRAVRSAALGYQLRYARRWEPAGELRKAVLCEETAPAIIEELERGLAFIQFGTVPDFDDPLERSKWLHRWNEFVARERGRRHEAE